jgi:hypothetical protein
MIAHDSASPLHAATVEDIDACFVVKDSGGQQLAYVYYEDEPRALTRTSCNWWVFPFSRYKYPEMKGEQRPTVRQ